MKKLFFIFLIPIFLSSQNKWEMTDSRAGGFFETLECIDSNNCFATTQNGRVLYSSNQGRKWKILLDELDEYNSAGYIEGASFIDTNIFFLVFYKGIIFKTTNGGKTFDAVDVREGTEIYWIQMFNENEGLANAAMWNQEHPQLGFFYTKDSWKTWDTIYNFENKENGYSLSAIDKPFLFDNKLLSRFTKYIYYEERNESVIYNNFGLLDIENKKYDSYIEIPDFTLYPYYSKTRNFYFQIHNPHKTSFNAIAKYDLKKNKWKRVLEFHKNGGLCDIAFKNDSVGIAVGRYGIILYTYDAGESWYFEQEHHDKIKNEKSSAYKVTYAGENPIIADNYTFLFRMTQDNLAPRPEDTLVISGYIMEDEKPLPVIPVALDNRYTMTDSNGFYQFIHIRPDKEYNLRVVDKYYEYTPYIYNPDTLLISTKKDTVINFQATDNRKFYSLSGSVSSNGVGLEDIVIQFGSNTVTTNEDGYFLFEKVEQWRHNLTPITKGYTYDPEFYDITLNQNISSMDFTASPISSVIDNPNFQINNNVLISKDITGLEYKIITLNGNIIESGTLPKELNLNQSSNGTYFLNITKGDKVVYTYKYQILK